MKKMTERMMSRAVNMAALSAVVVISMARAGMSEEGVQLRPVTDELTRKECSACHMPYPAALLPRRSWHAILSDLGNHFGEDASLDPKSEAEIRKWLEANAADTGGHLPGALRGLSPDVTPLRISELPIIKRIHRYEVGARWRKKVGSMGRCDACHRGAAQGYFGEG